MSLIIPSFGGLIQEHGVTRLQVTNTFVGVTNRNPALYLSSYNQSYFDKTGIVFINSAFRPSVSVRFGTTRYTVFINDSGDLAYTCGAFPSWLSAYKIVGFPTYLVVVLDIFKYIESNSIVLPINYSLIRFFMTSYSPYYSGQVGVGGVVAGGGSHIATAADTIPCLEFPSDPTYCFLDSFYAAGAWIYFDADGTYSLV